MVSSFSPAPPGYPRRFGQYLLLSPIAQGGMGDVFLASTIGVAGAVRLVVIKTLRQDLAMEDGYVNRFLDEARIVIQLQHPNISQVFDVGCIEGTHYFAMEHILGTNLRRLLDLLGKAKAKVPSPLAMFIAMEALEGLDCAHRHHHALTNEPLKVVHRDVSPHNIMISLNGEVKVIDFGLAESVLKVEQTETKVVLGKIAYMSPEQARGEEVDASADQFSAAVVLYEMLSGERYYGERVQAEIWAMAGMPGFVPDRMKDFDPELQAVLRKALASEPRDRYPTCAAFAHELRTLLNERFPETGRTTLKEFMRASASRELEHSEKNVRALSELALKTVPELMDSRTPLVTVVSESDTGATATAMAARGADTPRGVRAAAIVAGLAVAAILALVVVRALRDDEAAPVALAPPVAKVIDTVELPRVDEAPAPAAVVDAGLVDAPPPPPKARPRPKPPKKEVAPPPPPPPKKEAPSWTSWPLSKKVAALKSCNKPCAQTVKNVIAKGGEVKQPIVDVCLGQCGVR